MRSPLLSLKIAALTIFTTFAFVGSARADSVAATSIFTGTITQAPAGNIFGVTVGDPISGIILYPTIPVSPVDPVFVGADGSVGLTIGSITYVPVPPSGGDSVTLSTSTGLVTGIEWSYPPAPNRPPLTLSGNQFFTTDCAPGAVCGTLDFSNSQVTPTPEPSALLLMATGIVGVGLLATRRLRAVSRRQRAAASHPRPA
jgi:hypothetical protein